MFVTCNSKVLYFSVAHEFAILVGIETHSTENKIGGTADQLAVLLLCGFLTVNKQPSFRRRATKDTLSVRRSGFDYRYDISYYGVLTTKRPCEALRRLVPTGKCETRGKLEGMLIHHRATR